MLALVSCTQEGNTFNDLTEVLLVMHVTADGVMTRRKGHELEDYGQQKNPITIRNGCCDTSGMLLSKTAPYSYTTPYFSMRRNNQI